MLKSGWIDKPNTATLNLSAKDVLESKRSAITNDLKISSPDQAQESGGEVSPAMELLRQGFKQQQRGELASALESLQQALSMFLQDEDYRHQGQALCVMTQIAYSMGNYKNALAYGKQCLSIARNLSDLRQQVQV
nr:tetratricopeptide repeat protein [Nostocaceae cyanobacterium]